VRLLTDAVTIYTAAVGAEHEVRRAADARLEVAKRFERARARQSSRLVQSVLDEARKAAPTAEPVVLAIQ
jgi:hypothetical protein